MVLRISQCRHSRVSLALLILVAPLIGASTLAHAGLNVWTRSGPDGRIPNSLVVAPNTPATLYVSTSSGVFKSVDAGASWYPVNSGLDTFTPANGLLAIDPTHPDTLYLTRQFSGVYKTTTGGRRWAVAGTLPAPILAIAVDPLTPSRIYIGTQGGGIYRSLDSGASWLPASTGLNPASSIAALVTDPHTSGTLYASAQGSGLFKTTDGGQHWTAFGAGFNTGTTVQTVVIDPLTPSTMYAGTSSAGVFKSTDAGVNWNPLTNGLDSFSSVSSLVVDPVTPATLYAGTNSGKLYRTTNSGASWALLNGSYFLPSGVAIRSVTIDPLTPAILFLATSVGLFKTSDGGNSLDLLDAGLAHPTSASAIALDPVDAATLYAAAGSVVFKSDSGGSIWTTSSNGLYGFGFPGVISLAIDPASPRTLYAGTTNAGLFKTTNAGNAWGSVNAGINITQQVRAIAVDPTTPTTLYAGTSGGGIFKSLDGGLGWTPASVGLSSPSINTLMLHPQSPSTIYAGTQSGLFKSSDGAMTWRSVNSGLGVPPPNVSALAIDPSSPTTIFLGSSAGAFKSLDGGDAWQPLPGFPSQSIRTLAIDPATPTALYAGTFAGIYASTDGGDTWHTMNEGLDSLALFVNALAVARSGACLYAATQAGLFTFATRVDPCAALVPVVAAVLPSSRSVQVNRPATAFATIINPADTVAQSCRIVLPAGAPATLSFQATDVVTNQAIDTPGLASDIPPHERQTYLVSLVPTMPLDGVDIPLRFECATTAAAVSIPGVNTLLLSASSTPAPDIVALSATLNNDGVVDISAAGDTGVFSVAAVNVGASGRIAIAAGTGEHALPVTLSLCQTEPVSGQCLSAPAPTLTTQINSGDTPTFAIFVKATDLVPLDPAGTRVFVRFTDDRGLTSGATSVAVRTH